MPCRRSRVGFSARARKTAPEAGAVPRELNSVACQLPRAAWLGGIRACLKIRRGAVFAARAGWQGATKENTPGGSSAEEQRRRPALAAKTLRAARLLPLGYVVTGGTARSGDASPAPPRPKPKSLAAAPFPIFRQALRRLRPVHTRPSQAKPNPVRPLSFFSRPGAVNHSTVLPILPSQWDGLHSS